MELDTIFALQFALSLAVFGILAKWYAAPWLAGKPMRVALVVLVAPHAFRHIGLSFLVPGLTGASLPDHFALAAAYGDFLSGLLAIAAMFALRYGWRYAVPLTWIFSIVGTVDLLYALSHAAVIPQLGTTWLIPTFIVPLLLVTHVMVWVRLTQHARGAVACGCRTADGGRFNGPASTVANRPA